MFRQPGERLVVRISVDRIGGYGPKMQPWSYTKSAQTTLM